jgi:hypothetical protein
MIKRPVIGLVMGVALFIGMAYDPLRVLLHANGDFK